MYSGAIRGKENIEWVEVSEEETIDLDERNIKLAGMEMTFTEYQRCIRAVRPAAVVATEIHG